MLILRDENFIDKSQWMRGEWDQEPDLIEWRSETKPSFPCLIVRSDGTGALCGYVGVNETHPLYEVVYMDTGIDAHGSLTYSGKCQKDGKICHAPLKGEPDNIWWLGFDCAHCFDISPRLYYNKKLIKASGATYKNLSYVIEEVNSLASQLAEMNNIKRIEG